MVYIGLAYRVFRMALLCGTEGDDEDGGGTETDGAGTARGLQFTRRSSVSDGNGDEPGAHHADGEAKVPVPLHSVSMCMRIMT